MTEPCPKGLDCLIHASECGYPGWTESQCTTWLLCNESSEKDENECSEKDEKEEISRLEEEIKRLQSL